MVRARRRRRRRRAPAGEPRRRAIVFAVFWSSGYYQSFWGYYGYGWTNVYIARPSSEKTTYVVETLVYDLRQNRLVWAATSETTDPKGLPEFIADLVDAAVNEMKKMKLVG